MNETTIMLEGSKVGSNGARIELDMKNVKTYSLFPGQIVGVKGINTSGRKMVVEEIVEGLECGGGGGGGGEGGLAKRSVLRSDEEEEHDVEQDGMGMKILSVVGPYTSGQDLKYEPLMDLLNFVVQEKPSVVIMMGPFVDMRQELLKKEDEVILEYELENEDNQNNTMKRHVSYETLFAAKISQELEDLYEEFPDLKTKFVLVPSLEDGVSEPM